MSIITKFGCFSLLISQNHQPFFHGLWPLCHLRYIRFWGRLLTTYRFPVLSLNPPDHQQGLLKDPDPNFFCSFTICSGARDYYVCNLFAKVSKSQHLTQPTAPHSSTPTPSWYAVTLLSSIGFLSLQSMEAWAGTRYLGGATAHGRGRGT